MKINNKYISNNNSYDTNSVLYIVIHNTDNFKKTADAEAHAKAQYNGDLSGMSAHIYVDDKAAYQALPYNRGAWHIGVNYGRNNLFGTVTNRNCIAIEMCVNEGYDYEKAFNNTVDVTKQMMDKFKIAPGNVVQHYDVCSKDCPSQIRKRGDWGRFKSLITEELYRVRKSWDDAASQLFAGTLAGAKKVADTNPSYKVFDSRGNVVYIPDTGADKGIPASREDYLKKVSAICIDLYQETKILPSVVIAQCCLETGFGLGADSRLLVENNNLLGMKTDLINSTWSAYSVWKGKSFNKVTPEYRNGKLVYITDSFRIYEDYRNCIEDYEQFLLHVKSGGSYKYRAVQGLTDPKNVITIISKGGYATDPAYITKIMQLITDYDLTKYDREAGATDLEKDAWYRVAKDYKNGVYIGQTGAYSVKANAIAAADREGLNVYNQSGQLIHTGARERYAVRRRLSEEKYQLGLYGVLENAKKQADTYWGFRVYDLDTRTCIYKPTLTRWQKLLAACARLNQWLIDDIKAGKDWRYYNSGHVSESTFWKTRKANKLYTNCMGGVAFAMKESGIPPSACSWYGQQGGGIRWLNDHAERDLRKYADIIPIGGKKTVKQLVADGTLCPGDILTFVTLNHTCIYFGNNLSYDTGHAYCTEKGEGAHFVKWIGDLSWATYKVGNIIRLK